MSYRDELKFVAESDNSYFPEFLFNVMFNDFGDDYYKIGVSSDPLVLKARGLRKKYSNYFDYLEAMHIYNEYMDMLIDKYGSLSIVKNSYKAGVFDDILPSKPRLKRSKKNKEFLRVGDIPSHKILESGDNEIEFIESARELLPNKFGEDIEEIDMFKKPDKKTLKRFRRASEKIQGYSRRKNIYSNKGNNNGADFVIEYLNQANKGYYDEIGKRKELSVMEIYKEDERYKYTPAELIEAELLGNQSLIQNGRLIKASDYEKLEIIKDLYSIGIDVIGNMSKNMNKSAVRMIRQSLGAMDAEPMTKKELKKLKKRQKKERERINRQKDNDKLLSDVLLKNKFSFAKSGSTLNFRLRDIYNDD